MKEKRHPLKVRNAFCPVAVVVVVTADPFTVIVPVRVRRHRHQLVWRETGAVQNARQSCAVKRRTPGGGRSGKRQRSLPV